MKLFKIEMVGRDQLATSCKERLLETLYWVFDICIQLRTSTGRKTKRININHERSKRITKKSSVLRAKNINTSKLDQLVV